MDDGDVVLVGQFAIIVNHFETFSLEVFYDKVSIVTF